MTDQNAPIEIKVEVNFLAEQSLPDQNHYLFAYTISIRNHGEHSVKLLSRHWQITNGEGQVNVVDGPGVVGKQPTIEPGKRFIYTSSAAIDSPVGTMHGYYTFNELGDRLFDVPIPVFRLASPNTLH